MVEIFETSFVIIFAAMDISATIFAKYLFTALAIAGILWHFVFASICCRCSGADALSHGAILCYERWKESSKLYESGLACCYCEAGYLFDSHLAVLTPSHHQ